MHLYNPYHTSTIEVAIYYFFSSYIGKCCSGLRSAHFYQMSPQTLAQAQEAHKKNQFEEAERLYLSLTASSSDTCVQGERAG